MPIPFIFPIAGFVLTGAGMAMIVRYIQADEAHRGGIYGRAGYRDRFSDTPSHLTLFCFQLAAVRK